MKRLLPLLLVTGVVVIGGAFAWLNSEGYVPPDVADERAAPPRPPEATVEVQYIANEGVLISVDGRRVVIDGLHREYSSYPFLPEPHQGRLEAAAAPFDGIDLILVSHIHGDHFHPESVARYMQHSSKTVLASSEQVVREMQTHVPQFESIGPRVITVTPPLTQRTSRTVGGIDVEFLGLGHGTRRHSEVQNLGHVFTLGGKKMLHVGDADTAANIFDALDLDQAGIDIAFLPLWFLTDPAGQAVVREHIKPRQIVAIHMPARPDSAFDGIRHLFPNAVAFTTLLEKRYY